MLVERLATCGTIVVLGDSIVDGAGTEIDSATRWTDVLARRAAPQNLAIVNAGISGALLDDGMGVNALARFDHDVLAQPDLQAMRLVLGLNDIAWLGSALAPTAPQMTFARLPFRGALSGTPMANNF